MSRIIILTIVMLIIGAGILYWQTRRPEPELVDYQSSNTSQNGTGSLRAPGHPPVR
jgi:hypothetical protein